MKPHLCAACDEPIDRECGVLEGDERYHGFCWESLTAKDRKREVQDAEDEAA